MKKFLHLSWVNSRTHKPGDESGAFLTNLGTKLPNQTVQQPRRFGSQKQNQVFSSLSFPVGHAGILPHDLSRILRCIIPSLCLTFYTNDQALAVT